ncbi:MULTISPECIES: hypothetical protein [Chryseobacterium]|uniref:hypothetical protein n=1 Tax=Chryseobacterium TaxID=59732 RepID=UPI000C9E5289|nr:MULTISPECIES: hypothetical protein [Chryseobacterium]VXB69314.1 conserved membrane hypothetical protein [Chryseobacterium sp. 8AT]
MNWTETETWERIMVFLKNLPETISETFIWLIASYLIPLLNIGIIYGIQKDKFELNIIILGIIIATNACFYTSLYYLAFSNKKSRKLINTINITAFTTTVVLFSISIIEIEIKKPLFTIALYKITTLISFIVAVILALISKYDEVEAISRQRAKEGRETSETQIGDKKVKL